jgi:hypothetical protein
LSVSMRFKIFRLSKMERVGVGLSFCFDKRFGCVLAGSLLRYATKNRSNLAVFF